MQIIASNSNFQPIFFSKIKKIDRSRNLNIKNRNSEKENFIKNENKLFFDILNYLNSDNKNKSMNFMQNFDELNKIGRETLLIHNRKKDDDYILIKKFISILKVKNIYRRKNVKIEFQHFFKQNQNHFESNFLLIFLHNCNEKTHKINYKNISYEIAKKIILNMRVDKINKKPNNVSEKSCLTPEFLKNFDKLAFYEIAIEHILKKPEEIDKILKSLLDSNISSIEDFQNDILNTKNLLAGFIKNIKAIDIHKTVGDIQKIEEVEDLIDHLKDERIGNFYYTYVKLFYEEEMDKKDLSIFDINNSNFSENATDIDFLNKLRDLIENTKNRGEVYRSIFKIIKLYPELMEKKMKLDNLYDFMENFNLIKNYKLKILITFYFKEFFGNLNEVENYLFGQTSSNEIIGINYEKIIFDLENIFTLSNFKDVNNFNSILSDRSFAVKTKKDKNLIMDNFLESFDQYLFLKNTEKFRNAINGFNINESFIPQDMVAHERELNYIRSKKNQIMKKLKVRKLLKINRRLKDLK